MIGVVQWEGSVGWEDCVAVLRGVRVLFLRSGSLHASQQPSRKRVGVIDCVVELDFSENPVSIRSMKGAR